MPKKKKPMNANGKKRTRREWTKADIQELNGHSKSKTTVVKVSRTMKRTEAALRQKAFQLGIGLGHQR
jgi:hypothetical protein